MSERSGFFNAIETGGGTYDRVYDAEDFAQYFATFIGNGVFINPSDQLKVIPKTGLTVTVKAGKAFIDGYWYELDEDMDITLTANGTSNTINDVIACTLNKSNRTITIVKKESVRSTLPVNNGTTHELILAVVSVGVGVSNLTASNITDTRPDNTYCGFVGALIEQVDFGNLFDQMESQFNVWFDEMKDQLTEDAAGNLQTQIDELEEQIGNVVTQINGNTAIVTKAEVFKLKNYSVTTLMDFPEGFNENNCYIKSYSVKYNKDYGGNSGALKGLGWCFAGAGIDGYTDSQYRPTGVSLASWFANGKIKCRIGSANLSSEQGNVPKPVYGYYDYRVVLEKIVE